MRRLQIKSKSKIKKKSRGYLLVSFNYYFYYCFLHKGVLCNLVQIAAGTAVGNDRSHSKDFNVNSVVEDSTIAIEESSISNSESHNNKNSSSLWQINVAAPFASKKHQKLHWGYVNP